MAAVSDDVPKNCLSKTTNASVGATRSATFTDASRATLAAKWFHAAYLGGVIAQGQKIALYGKVEFDGYRGEISMLHPEFEILGEEEEGEAGLLFLGALHRLDAIRSTDIRVETLGDALHKAVRRPRS